METKAWQKERKSPCLTVLDHHSRRPADHDGAAFPASRTTNLYFAGRVLSHAFSLPRFEYRQSQGAIDL
jgi:hypothetical protein